MSGQGDDSEGAHSQIIASTSSRCGFLWLHTELDEQLANWSLQEGVDMDTNAYTYRFMTVCSSRLKRFVGRGGRMLHKLESFVGVFASMEDTGEGPMVCFASNPCTCLLAEFIVEMI